MTYLDDIDPPLKDAIEKDDDDFMHYYNATCRLSGEVVRLRKENRRLRIKIWLYLATVALLVVLAWAR